MNAPNIIFIMADDHAAKAISAYGGGINKTPNIDRIANEELGLTIVMLQTQFARRAELLSLQERTIT